MASLLTSRRRAAVDNWQNAGRQYLDDAAAQAVAAFRGIATGRAIVALVATSLCRLHRKGMMTIAEIIHKKWGESILAGNYQL